MASMALAAGPAPVDVFREQSTYQIVNCQNVQKAMAIKPEVSYEQAIFEMAKCVKYGKAEVRKTFPAALAAAAKKPDAAKLLKDYYAAWITAIDGIMPNGRELKIAYEQRQIASESKCGEIWNRFEIEAGY